MPNFEYKLTKAAQHDGVPPIVVGSFRHLSGRARALSREADYQRNDRHGHQRRAEPQPLRRVGFGLQIVHFLFAPRLQF